jgi:glutamate-ammonia-ligase adenylyltransferase
LPKPSDLFLSPDLTEEQARVFLRSLGFRDVSAVDGHLQSMADDLFAREALGRLAPELFPALLESPDPDAAVAGLSQYVAARSGRAMFLDYLRDDPRALHVLTYIMGASPFLKEILVRSPEYFHWLVAQVDRSAPDRQDHDEELVGVFATVDEPAEALNMLRRWKRRELLRIGTRELLRRETVSTVATQLSDVACVVVDFALAIVMHDLLNAEGLDQAPGACAIIATGKLGAGELSYSSDIELLFVYDTREAIDNDAARVFFIKLFAGLASALRDDAADGRLYGVEEPPWVENGGSMAARSLEEFAEHAGGATARRALVRARPIAGDAELGARFMQACQPLIYREDGANGFESAVVSNGPGTDDIEFLIEGVTQVWQLRHGARHSSLRQTGTLGALDAMRRAGLLPDQICRELDHAYILTRSAAHRRQLGLQEDVQKQLDASRARVLEICRSLAL